MDFRAIRSAPVGEQSGNESANPVVTRIELPPLRKQRKLDRDKCQACRDSKQKCSPPKRKWPGERCQRCINKNLPCSASERKQRAAAERSAVPASDREAVSYVSPPITVRMDVQDHEAIFMSGEKTISIQPASMSFQMNHQRRLHQVSSTTMTSFFSTKELRDNLKSLLQGQSPPLPDQQVYHSAGQSTSFLDLTLFMVRNGMLGDHYDTRAAYSWMKSHLPCDMVDYFCSLNHPTSIALLDNIFLLAIRAEDLPIVKQFLARGQYPSGICCPCCQKTALQHACQRMNPDIVGALLDAGADPNEHFEDDFKSSLYLTLVDLSWPDNEAALDIMQMLLNKGAHVNGLKYAPLHAAVASGDLQAVKLLLARGADVNFSAPEKGSGTALAIAIIDEMENTTAIDIVKLLLKNGADVNLGCDYGGYKSYVELAVAGGSPEILQLLLDHGALPSQDALELAVNVESIPWNEEEDNYPMVKMLLSSRAYVTAEIIKESVSLDYMDVNLVLLLVNYHGSGHWARRFGSIAFTEALRLGRNRLVEELASRHVALDEEGDLEEAIESVALRGDKQLISLLFDDQSPYKNVASRYLGDSLSAAISRGHQEITETLLKVTSANAPLSLPGPKSVSAALKKGKINLARRLLGAGASVTLVTSTTVKCILPSTIPHGYLFLAREIIAVGADIDAPGLDDDPPALVLAVQHGRRDMIELLINAGADINICGTHDGRRTLFSLTPLHAAVRRKDIELVKYLLTLGADPKDERALCEAVESSCKQVVRILLEAVQSRYQHHPKLFARRALQKAIHQKDTATIISILTFGVDLDATVQSGPAVSPDEPAESCFGTAIRLDQGPNYPIVKKLLQAGADPNRITFTSADGTTRISQTALLQAIEERDPALVKFLIEGRANVNNPNVMVLPYSPLQQAVKEEAYQIVELLLANGANVNEPATEFSGATALQLAAITGNLGIINLLLNHGADINAPPAAMGGKTALEGAAEHGRVDTVLLFLSKNIQIPVEQYRRAASLARKNGKRGVSQLLENAASELET